VGCKWGAAGRRPDGHLATVGWLHAVHAVEAGEEGAGVGFHMLDVPGQHAAQGGVEGGEEWVESKEGRGAGLPVGR
jgi:hypothetical protein